MVEKKTKTKPKSKSTSKKTTKKSITQKTTRKTSPKPQKKQCKISNKKLFIVCIILLVLVIAAVVTGIVTTAARYATQVSGTAKSSVAYWRVEITDDNSEPLTNNFTLYPDISNIHTQVVDGKIAPGSELYAGYSIDLEGTEVATDIEAIITYDRSKLPANAVVLAELTDVMGHDGCENDPIDEDGDGVITCSMTLSVEDALSAVAHLSGYFLVSWANNEQQNPTDTAAGIAAENFPINVTLSAKQHFE